MSVVSRWKDLGEAREAEDPVWRAYVREGSVQGKGTEDGWGGQLLRGFKGGESLVAPRERLVRFRYCFCEL